MIPKLFIETSVFNFYLEGKQGRKQQDAIKLFDEISAGRYEAYTSEAVLIELRGASEKKARKMEKLIRQYIKRVIDPTEKSQNLANLYVDKGIIPAKYKNDALHIATAVAENLDFVISFNQGHIVKLKTMTGIGFVNLREGYPMIGLSTPTEVIEYDC